MGGFSLKGVNAAQSLSESSEKQAVGKLRATGTDSDNDKIDKSARDFESILIGQWLQDAEKSFAAVPGADPEQNSDAGHDQLRSMAMQFLASGLSKKGGFGIAQMISHQLKAHSAPKDPSAEVVSAPSERPQVVGR